MAVGLDARAAAIVMKAVKNTVQTGRTVVCTIHQPSMEIFQVKLTCSCLPPCALDWFVLLLRVPLAARLPAQALHALPVFFFRYNNFHESCVGCL